MKKFLMLLVLAALWSGLNANAITFYVCGISDSGNVFDGGAWGAGFVDGNKMTACADGSTYYLIKNVTVTETITYKFTSDDGNGNRSWAAGDNKSIDVVAGQTLVFILKNSINDTGNEAYSFSTLTVAGGSTSVFGTEWSSSSEANKMTSTDGFEYQLLKEKVSLTAGTIEYKVVLDGTNWYPASDNLQLIVPATGYYNVLFTFDIRNKEVNARAIWLGDYAVYGGEGDTYTGWAKIGNMTKSGTTYTYTFDRQSDSDAYTFFVAPSFVTINGDGSVSDWGALYRPDYGTTEIGFTPSNNNGTQHGGDNNKWVISTREKVDFTFNASDATWSVAPFIEKTIANNDMKLGTFSADGKAAVPDGVTAYIGKLNGDAVTLEKITGAIPANTGILYKGTTPGATVKFYATNDDAASVTGNVLEATGSAGKTLSTGDYVLATVSGENLAFYPVNGTPYYEPFKAYIPQGSAAKLAINFGDETGIATLSHEKTDNVYYDLQGRRVMNPTKGLFIVNGKKVIK